MLSTETLASKTSNFGILEEVVSLAVGKGEKERAPPQLRSGLTV